MALATLIKSAERQSWMRRHQAIVVAGAAAVAAIAAAGFWLWPHAPEERQASAVDPPAADVRALILHFQTADPAEDLQAALAKGDARFIAVMGVGMRTPGVPVEVADRHGVWTVPFVTDVVATPQHADLERVAVAYAERYNTLLLAHLATSERR